MENMCHTNTCSAHKLTCTESLGWNRETVISLDLPLRTLCTSVGPAVHLWYGCRLTAVSLKTAMFCFLALFALFYSLGEKIVPPSNHSLPVPLVRTGVTSKGSVVGFKVLAKTACKFFFFTPVWNASCLAWPTCLGCKTNWISPGLVASCMPACLKRFVYSVCECR